MAQPARVLRAQRARRRRRLVLSTRLSGRATQIVALKWLLVWLRYFSQPLQLASLRLRRLDRASLAARAVLEGASFAGPYPPAETIDTLKRPQLYRLRDLSLRYAAHTVAVGLVLSVALCSGELPSQPDRLRAPVKQAAREQNSDLLITRTFAFAPETNVPALSVPMARRVDEQFAPVFSEHHTLAEGETLGQLAAEYQVSVASLFWSNDLASSPVLAMGEDLRIPRLSGVPHIVAPGETLDSLATLFHVGPEAIVLFKPNRVSAGQPLSVGQEIFIPGGTQDYPADLLAQEGGEQGLATMRAVAAGTVQSTDTNLRSGPGRDYPRLGYLDAGQHTKLLARHDAWVQVDSGAGVIGWVRADLLGLSDAAIAKLAETNDFPPPPPVWIWPTRGSITSPFGWRTSPWRMFHDGLDIANRAGTKIYAARSGQVSEAGWCSGFGYCVKINHGDGISTIYGHMLKRPPVHAGDTVSVGDLIGWMGSTYDASGGGYSTGVHLHFTVKVNGKAVNPLNFLP